MFKLRQTCGGYPESYNVYYNDHKVGSMHLHHGYFVVNYGEDDQIVYEANPHGDGVFGYDEREHYLNVGCHAIKNAMERDSLEVIYDIE